jgi:16S rRNA (guanine527-N7)-methyltransferase
METRSHVLDIGSGGGLPIIPCLVARPDLSATLFESSPKKAVFLREAVDRAGARGRGVIVTERFEHRSTPQGNVLTCRAIERFADILPDIYNWAPPNSRLLLFAGRSVQKLLGKSGVPFNTFLIPDTEQRYLFVLEKRARPARP